MAKKGTGVPRWAKKLRRGSPVHLRGDEKVLKSGTIELPAGSIPSPSGGRSSAIDFTSALLRGDPLAQAAVDKILKEEEPSLADKFIAETFVSYPGYTRSVRRLWDQAMIEYRSDMRKAHRFVLDDEFVAMCTQMATTRAEKTLARLQYANLPYEHTWIEFNLHAKVRELRRLHKSPSNDYSEVSPRLGMLMQRINENDAVITLVQEHKSTLPHATCYFYSTTESNFLYDRKPFGCTSSAMIMENAPERTLKLGEEIKADELQRGSLWGYTTKSHKGMLNPDFDGDVTTIYKTPAFLNRHGVTGISRMHPVYKQAFTAEKDMVHMLGAGELREFVGHIRWVVTLLAMLNEVPVTTKHVEREGQMRLSLTKRAPFVDYHQVTLRLPKKSPIPYIERQLREAGRRRAHEVRQHWRTYLHEKRCAYEEHAWEYDHDNGYRLCGKCEAYGRLIHEHIRGDMSLGWVNKNYLIKPSKQE